MEASTVVCFTFFLILFVAVPPLEAKASEVQDLQAETVHLWKPVQDLWKPVQEDLQDLQDLQTDSPLSEAVKKLNELMTETPVSETPVMSETLMSEIHTVAEKLQDMISNELAKNITMDDMEAKLNELGNVKRKELEEPKELVRKVKRIIALEAAVEVPENVAKELQELKHEMEDGNVSDSVYETPGVVLGSARVAGFAMQHGQKEDQAGAMSDGKTVSLVCSGKEVGSKSEGKAVVVLIVFGFSMAILVLFALYLWRRQRQGASASRKGLQRMTQKTR